MAVAFLAPVLVVALTALELVRFWERLPRWGGRQPKLGKRIRLVSGRSCGFALAS
jgi:hypothetical protein